MCHCFLFKRWQNLLNRGFKRRFKLTFFWKGGQLNRNGFSRKPLLYKEGNLIYSWLAAVYGSGPQSRCHIKAHLEGCNARIKGPGTWWHDSHRKIFVFVRYGQLLTATRRGNPIGAFFSMFHRTWALPSSSNVSLLIRGAQALKLVLGCFWQLSLASSILSYVFLEQIPRIREYDCIFRTIFWLYYFYEVVF